MNIQSKRFFAMVMMLFTLAQGCSTTKIQRDEHQIQIDYPTIGSGEAKLNRDGFHYYEPLHGVALQNELASYDYKSLRYHLMDHAYLHTQSVNVGDKEMHRDQMGLVIDEYRRRFAESALSAEAIRFFRDNVKIVSFYLGRDGNGVRGMNVRGDTRLKREHMARRVATAYYKFYPSEIYDVLGNQLAKELIDVLMLVYQNGVDNGAYFACDILYGEYLPLSNALSFSDRTIDWSSPGALYPRRVLKAKLPQSAVETCSQSKVFYVRLDSDARQNEELRNWFRNINETDQHYQKIMKKGIVVSDQAKKNYFTEKVETAKRLWDEMESMGVTHYDEEIALKFLSLYHPRNRDVAGKCAEPGTSRHIRSSYTKEACNGLGNEILEAIASKDIKRTQNKLWKWQRLKEQRLVMSGVNISPSTTPLTCIRVAEKVLGLPFTVSDGTSMKSW